MHKNLYTWGSQITLRLSRKRRQIKPRLVDIHLKDLVKNKRLFMENGYFHKMLKTEKYTELNKQVKKEVVKSKNEMP